MLAQEGNTHFLHFCPAVQQLLLLGVIVLIVLGHFSI